MKKAALFLFFFFSALHASWNSEVLSESPKVILLENFLSPMECDHLINLASPYLERSYTVNPSEGGGNQIDSRRTSMGTFLTGFRDDPILQTIENRLSELTGYPKENAEAIQVLQYGVGAEYQPHYDFFRRDLPGESVCLDRGGQRVITVIMYLNDPIQGGETIFPKAGYYVNPKKGRAVLFYNCLPSGEEDYMSFHGGCPVIKGEKWIATRWFRSGRFQ